MLRSDSPSPSWYEPPAEPPEVLVADAPLPVLQRMAEDLGCHWWHEDPGARIEQMGQEELITFLHGKGVTEAVFERGECERWVGETR